MKEVNYINGECGEQLLVYSVRLKKAGYHERKCVNIDLEGLISDSDGGFCVTLSPHVAIKLAEELRECAEHASEENYHILSEEKAED